MHVILGLLGTIVTILFLLHRLAEMGIDLAGLNPFLWARRRKWKRYHDANPIFKIESPLEATALLLVAVAKADGDMSSEEKRAILNTYTDEFHLTKKEAAGLLISSSFLFAKGEEIRTQLAAVLAPSSEAFTKVQAESALALMRKIAGVGRPATELQNDLIDQTSRLLMKPDAPGGQWH